MGAAAVFLGSLWFEALNDIATVATAMDRRFAYYQTHDLFVSSLGNYLKKEALIYKTTDFFHFRLGDNIFALMSSISPSKPYKLYRGIKSKVLQEPTA